MSLNHGWPDRSLDEREPPPWPQCVCCGAEDDGTSGVELAPTDGGDLLCGSCRAAIDASELADAEEERAMKVRRLWVVLGGWAAAVVFGAGLAYAVFCVLSRGGM